MVTKAKDSHANAKPKQIKARTIHAYGAIMYKPDLLVSCRRRTWIASDGISVNKAHA